MEFFVPKVRTLEQALDKEFDRDRRLHGWAREGMEMDRDDFIDLALVSKLIPGKTPSQVSCKTSYSKGRAGGCSAPRSIDAVGRRGNGPNLSSWTP